MRRFLRILLALNLMAWFALVHAQSWPARPIRLIVPYAVGQGTDIAARYLAEEIGKEIKQPMIVENRPGAGGNVGTQAAARATPDGYTIMIGTNATHAANAFLFSNIGYDPKTDFEPIGMVGILPLVYVTHLNNPVSTMPELVRASRARPDALNIAVSTTTCRLAHELFKQRADAPMFPVDFKGSAQALTAVMGGQIEYMVDTITSLRSAINNKQVKALGVTSARSSSLLPGVPSVAEQGVPGYELVGWIAFFAPRATPSDALRGVSAALTKALSRPEVRERLLQLGIETQPRTPDELRSYTDAERDKWERLIRMAGIKPSS